MPLDRLRSDHIATRLVAQRIATHVMSRVRKASTGRIDLAPMPGGFGTPAFGEDHRVLRVDGDLMVIESTGDPVSTRYIRINDSSLADLAHASGAALDEEFDVGHDTPDVGNRHDRLVVNGAAMVQIGEWFALGAMAVDHAVAGFVRPGIGSASPGRARIWPEHFDLAIDLNAGPRSRVNLGASAGDGHHPSPYLYVGPWQAVRPGPPGYWNAPFGATVDHATIAAADDPVSAAVAFLREGLDRLAP